MKTTEVYNFIKGSKKDLVALQGGTYSTKTYSALQHALIEAAKDKEKTLTSVVGVTMPHIKRGALRDFTDILQKEGLYDTSVTHNKTDNIFKVGKSEIEFFSADNDDKVRGAKRQRLFINEANLLNFEKYRQLKTRTSEWTILDWNPTARFWWHEKLEGKRDYDFCISSYKNNPFIAESIIKEIESYKEDDPDYYKIYGLGLTGNLKGLIFRNTRVVQAFPGMVKNEGYGLDFGFSNSPTCLSHNGIYRGEIFSRELIYETGMTGSDIVARLKELGISKRLPIYADPEGAAEIEEIKRAGYNVIKANKSQMKGESSILYGIGILKDYWINITSDSPGFIKESQSYIWRKDKDGKSLNIPIKRNDHFFDGLRYWARGELGVKRRVSSFASR